MTTVDNIILSKMMKMNRQQQIQLIQKIRQLMMLRHQQNHQIDEILLRQVNPVVIVTVTLN